MLFSPVAAAVTAGIYIHTALRTVDMYLLQGLSSTSELGNVSLVAAGAAAGAAYWGSVYPADIIKSRLQVDSFTHPRYAGIMDCARQVGLLLHTRRA